MASQFLSICFIVCKQALRSYFCISHWLIHLSLLVSLEINIFIPHYIILIMILLLEALTNHTIRAIWLLLVQYLGKLLLTIHHVWKVSPTKSTVLYLLLFNLNISWLLPVLWLLNLNLRCLLPQPKIGCRDSLLLLWAGSYLLTFEISFWKLLSLHALYVNINLFGLPVIMIHVLGILDDLTFEPIEEFLSCFRQVNLSWLCVDIVFALSAWVLDVFDSNSKVVGVINFESTVSWMDFVTKLIAVWP